MEIIAMSRNSQPRVVVFTPLKMRHRYFIKKLIENGIKIDTVVVPNKDLKFRIKLIKFLSISAILDGVLSCFEILLKGNILFSQKRLKIVNNYKEKSIPGLLDNKMIDAALIYGGPIIPNSILKSVCIPFLNVHGAVLPGYRGLDSHWWLFMDNRTELQGYSIHAVAKELDSGKIFKTRRFSSRKFSITRLLLWRLWIAENSAKDIAEILYKPILLKKSSNHDLEFSVYRSSISLSKWLYYKKKSRNFQIDNE
jgi:hypothetical protein